MSVSSSRGTESDVTDLLHDVGSVKTYIHVNCEIKNLELGDYNYVGDSEDDFQRPKKSFKNFCSWLIKEDVTVKSMIILVLCNSDKSEAWVAEEVKRLTGAVETEVAHTKPRPIIYIISAAVKRTSELKRTNITCGHNPGIIPKDIKVKEFMKSCECSCKKV